MKNTDDLWYGVGQAVTDLMNKKFPSDDWVFLKGDDNGDRIKVTCGVLLPGGKTKKFAVVLPAEMFR